MISTISSKCLSFQFAFRPALLLLFPFTLAEPRLFCLSSLVNQVNLVFTYTFWFAVRQRSKITWRSIVTVCDCSTDCTIFISNCLHFLQNYRFKRKTSPKSRVLFELDARVKPHRHGSSTTFETKSCYYRVTQQPLPCYTAVARFGFKRCATVAVKSNLIRLIEFDTAITRFATGVKPCYWLDKFWDFYNLSRNVVATQVARWKT